MSRKVEIDENIVWDLIRKKQTVDAVKSWVADNQVELRTLNLLPGIIKILYTADHEGSESKCPTES